MKKSFALLCLLFLLSSPASPQAPSAKQRPLVLTHVTVIDTTGAPAQPDVAIVIRGDRIAGMGKSGKIRLPAGSQVVDATGKFLIPGLWDMNVFWYDPTDYLPLFIANGVTGVQEVLGYAEHHEFKKEVEAGQLLAPRWVIGTRWVVGPMRSSDPDDKALISVTNEAQAREAVMEAQKYGADFIEIGGAENVPRDAFFALADEAKKRGIPFEGYVPVSVSVAEASNAGLRNIGTMPSRFDIGILAASSAREADLLKSWQEALAKVRASEEPNLDVLGAGPAFRTRMQLALETYDRKKVESLSALLKANHTWMCPTLIAQHNSTFFDDPSVASDPRFKYMSVGERSWLDEKKNQRSKTTPEDNAVRNRYYQKYFEIVGAMRRAGVELLAGTTTEEPMFTVPGFSLHDEMALLVQAGLTPMEALQTATLNPARFLGKEQDFGSIAPGKFADLVLLDANPLEDISNTRKIAAVVYGGKLFPRASLDAMLAKIEALASRKSIGEVFKATMKERGVEAAIRQYRELKSTQWDSYDFEDKYGLIGPADRLLRAKKFKEAIQILELNTEMFPRWWWTYNSLGEAYIAVGEKELAIRNYKKSLELDPANQNATVKLKQLNSQ